MRWVRSAGKLAAPAREARGSGAGRQGGPGPPPSRPSAGGPGAAARPEVRPARARSRRRGCREGAPALRCDRRTWPGACPAACPAPPRRPRALIGERRPCGRSLVWPRPARADYSSRRAARGCARSGRRAAGPVPAAPLPAAAVAPTPAPGFARGLLQFLGMARPLVPSSQKALLLELKGLQEEPVEGFRVNLVDEGDLYNWEVAIFGPPNTYYEGGYFKVRGWGQQGGRAVSGGARSRGGEALVARGGLVPGGGPEEWRCVVGDGT